MHEWALAEGVVTTSLEAADRQNMKAIHRIVVTVGELQRISPEFFHKALEAVRPEDDDRLASTEFELKSEPVQFACRPCGHRFDADASTGGLTEDQAEAIHFVPELAHSFLSCPKCKSPDFEVVAGRGVWLESIEGE